MRSIDNKMITMGERRNSPDAKRLLHNERKKNSDLKEANKKLKYFALLFIAAFGVSTIFWLPSAINAANSFFNPDQPAPPATTVTTSFEIVVKDGKSFATLPNDDFDYTLYGLVIGGDPEDFLDWDVIESGTTLDGIKNADLDTSEFSAFYMCINGTISEAEFDDGLGDRTYNERWAPIYPNYRNVVNVYWQPSTAFFSCFNKETGAYITLASTNITCATNFTILVGTNASQPTAVYRYQYDLEEMAYIRPELVIACNTTMLSKTLSIPGTTKTKLNDTAYSYGFDEIGAIPRYVVASWDDAAADIEVIGTSMILRYDGTTI